MKQEEIINKNCDDFRWDIKERNYCTSIYMPREPLKETLCLHPDAIKTGISQDRCDIYKNKSFCPYYQGK